MKTMGDVIAQKRKDKGMTQMDLALKMNVTDKAVSKWERNISCPDVNSLTTLADLLGVSVNELLDAREANNANDGKDTEEAPNEAAKIIALILKAIPLAMGVAVVVLSSLDKLDLSSGFSLLGIGLTCLSIASLPNQRAR